jgi:hypothetical protein
MMDGDNEEDEEMKEPVKIDTTTTTTINKPNTRAASNSHQVNNN